MIYYTLLINKKEERPFIITVNSGLSSDLSTWNVSFVTDMGNMFINCLLFNQDLSSWFVTNILTLPIGFDSGASIWVLSRPIWGTYPP